MTQLAAPLTQQSVGEAIYATVKADVLRSAPGTRLVSERKLARQHAASHSTVRRVMNRLQDEGLVNKIHGGGCFVAERELHVPGLQTVVYVDTEIGSVSHPFFARRLAGMLDTCEALGFRLQIVRHRLARTLDGDPNLMQELERQDVAAAVVPWMAIVLLDRLRAANPELQVVTTATRYPPSGVSAVYPDYGALGNLAVRHVRAQGGEAMTLLYDQHETLAGAHAAVDARHDGQPSFTLTGIHATLKSDPSQLAAQVVRAGHHHVATDDSQTTKQVMAALATEHPAFAARCRWVSQANVGDDSLAPAIARLETDGYLHGRSLIETLHRQLKFPGQSSTVTLIGPRLRTTPDGS